MGMVVRFALLSCQTTMHVTSGSCVAFQNLRQIHRESRAWQYFVTARLLRRALQINLCTCDR